jgi:hypothetical protein
MGMRERVGVPLAVAVAVADAVVVAVAEAVDEADAVSDGGALLPADALCAALSEPAAEYVYTEPELVGELVTIALNEIVDVELTEADTPQPVACRAQARAPA